MQNETKKQLAALALAIVGAALVLAPQSLLENAPALRLLGVFLFFGGSLYGVDATKGLK